MTTKPKTNPDRPFNPFRKANSEACRGLVADVLIQFQGYENHKQTRKRSRKTRDQAILEQQIEALVSDLVHRYLTAPEGWIAVTMSNQKLCSKDIYRSELLNKTFPTVVKVLASPELAFAELVLGNHSERRQTTIKAGKRLISRIKDRGLAPFDLGIDKSSEPIVLRRSKITGEKKAKNINYVDTPVTKRYRQEMNQINEYLANADIQYHGKDTTVDETTRYLRRIFNNGSFELGGRLYGGFWQWMKSEHRDWITINDEEVTCLDYGQIGLYIAYSLCGETPEFDDGYAIPELIGDRELIKKFVNKLYNCEAVPKKLPKGIRLAPSTINWAFLGRDGRTFTSNDRARIEAGVAADLVNQYHHKIGQFFLHRNSLGFMHLESQIMIQLLLDLNSQGITALPVHDAVLVKASDVVSAAKVMRKAAKKILNLDVPVSIG